MTTRVVDHGELRATVEPAALEPSPPAAAAQRTPFPLQVAFPGTVSRTYETLADFRTDFDGGAIRRDFPARTGPSGADSRERDEDGAAAWRTIGEVAREHPRSVGSSVRSAARSRRVPATA